MHSPIPQEVIIRTPYYEAFNYPSRDNVVVIKLFDHPNATDAVPGRYPPPTQTDSRAKSDGSVDYYAEADEDGLNRWKRILGQIVAKHVVKPAVEGRGHRWTYGIEQGVLLDFPAGYKLFVHRKGDRHIPRKDYYLMGSQFARTFRSPQEFLFHLKWLMEGRPLKADNTRDCTCCYCDSAATQGDISRRYHLGLPPERPEKKAEQGEKGKKEGQKRQSRRSLPPLVIQAKDYTQLNSNTRSPASG
ncbi:hypothetical protein EIP91_011727 [Steccherinum ochraceum]|uniref:Cryptic loci regulator 2 N-terminal domain-containing protein n=1 Tax=Steccherinum ochraceum TaxID=92696 RepID=A0A4R0RYC0_9APHY|nr:hypothetical protein EIP91_011727 [Steccherinum ochraceum]